MNSYEFKIYKQTMIDIYHKMKWQLEINEKMKFHKNNETWILIIFVSTNRKIFIEKWIYKIKRNINDEITRYKTRWCVRDFKQIENFDYHEIFVVVIKSINYKIIFVIVVVNDWKLKQINVKIVFFYDTIEKKIYVKIFHEYKNLKKFKIIYRFKKILYDLKQFFRVWSKIFNDFFRQYKFKFLNVDQNVFCNDTIIIVIYVNDLFIAKFNKIDNRVIKIVFNKRFQIIDLNFLVYYLDMNIQRNRQQRIFYFNQKIYLKKIFQNHEITSSSKHVTSMKIICKLKIILFNYVAILEFKRKY